MGDTRGVLRRVPSNGGMWKSVPVFAMESGLANINLSD